MSAKPPFIVGDTVAIGKLSSVGTIVSIDGAHARVQMRGMIMKVQLARLTHSSDSAIPRLDPSHRITIDAVGGDESPSQLMSLDLHGKFTAEAVELVEQRVSRAVMAGLYEIEIQHGLGSGKVRDAVHAALSKLSAVARFELKSTNRGVTRVFLRG